MSRCASLPAARCSSCMVIGNAPPIHAVSSRVCCFEVLGDGHAMLRRAHDWSELTARFVAAELALRTFDPLIEDAMQPTDPEGTLDTPADDDLTLCPSDPESVRFSTMSHERVLAGVQSDPRAILPGRRCAWSVLGVVRQQCCPECLAWSGRSRGVCRPRRLTE